MTALLKNIDTSCPESVVIGGGFSGLITAYSLAKAGQRVTLYEKSPRWGGLIQSRFLKSGLAESAAHSLLLTPAVEAFFNELKIPFIEVNPHSKSRFIFRKGIGKNSIRRLPVQALKVREWIFLFQKIVKIPKPLSPEALEQLTLEEWSLRYLSKPALDHLVSPFVAGIYAASPKELLVKRIFPDLLVPNGVSFFAHLKSTLKKARYARKQGHTKKKVMVTPLNGMQDVIDKLVLFLSQHPLVKLKSESLQPKDLNPSVQTVVCLPAYEAADFAEIHDTHVAALLREIPYAPLVSITLFIKSDKFKKSLSPSGVGILTSAQQSEKKILGVLFNSSAFPKRVVSSDLHSFTVMMGGTKYPEVVSLDDELIHSILKEELPEFLGLKTLTSESIWEEIQITRWKKAIPVYGAQLDAALNALSKNPPLENVCPLFFFGNYLGQISLRGLIEAWGEKLASQRQRQ